jgi:excisionase family DNA binding protein
MNVNDAKEKLVSVEDVAEYIGVKRDTVRNWIRQGLIPGYKIGKLWKLKMPEVEAWISSRAAIGNDRLG